MPAFPDPPCNTRDRSFRGGQPQVDQSDSPAQRPALRKQLRIGFAGTCRLERKAASVSISSRIRCSILPQNRSNRLSVN
jgi:hypothetical protein